MKNNPRTSSEGDRLPPRSDFKMKMTVTHIRSSTSAPRSPDRWDVPVRLRPQLCAAARRREAVARQPNPLLHSVHFQIYMTNMLCVCVGSGEYTIIAYLHHVLFQSKKPKCLKSWVITLKTHNCLIIPLWECNLPKMYMCWQASITSLANGPKPADATGVTQKGTRKTTLC